MPPCQNLNIFPLGLQKPGSFWELKKKRPALMDTDTKQMSLSKDCTDAHAFLCTTVQSGKKKMVKQLSSVMSLTATFDSLYLSLSRRAMCRESGFFPTETKFLPSDPHRHPHFSPPSISVFPPLSCEGKQPDPKHPSFITLSSRDRKKERKVHLAYASGVTAGSI